MKYSRKISDGFTEERWKGFVDTPDEEKENYLSSIIEENASAKQDLRSAEKQLLNEFVSEYPEKAVYIGSELDEYATLRSLKKDPIYSDVYKEIVSPLVSKANDYTWLTNQMNEHLGYPYGFEGGGKAYRRNKTADSRKVSDGYEDDYDEYHPFVVCEGMNVIEEFDDEEEAIDFAIQYSSKHNTDYHIEVVYQDENNTLGDVIWSSVWEYDEMEDTIF